MALLLLLLAACAAGLAWSCALERVAELPLQMVLDTVPLMPVDINGHAANLVLDTGSNATVPTSIAAKRLGVAWDESAPLPVTGAGGTAQAFVAKVPSLVLGDDVTSDLKVLVGQGLPPMVDGVVGIDVLEKPALYVADLPSLMGDLIIGSGCLATRRIWLSFGTGQVFVTSSDQP